MLYVFYKQLGNRIFVRYKLPDQPITKTKIINSYKPTLYTKSNDTDSDVTSIYGYSLKPIEFDSIKAAKSFGDQYKDVDNFVIEGNNNYANQFMIDLYEGQSPEYTDDMIRVGILDIEVFSESGFPYPEQAEWPINGITIYDTIDKMFYTFGLKHKDDDHWSKEQSTDEVRDLNVTYFEFETEKDLMRSFLSHMNDHQYDITSGWNSESFDMPYIVNRCFKLFGEAYTSKLLSPFNKIDIKEVRSGFGGKTQQKVEIFGLPHLDYMQVYKKHTYTPRESYKLDFIAYAELGENKLNYEEYGDLQDLYVKNYQLFLDYNIQDVNIIKRLDEKLGLFALVYAMTYYTLSNYEDTMGTVKIWEQLVAKYLYNNNQVPPFRHMKKEERDFEGAFVKEVNPGIYDWVVSYDLNSLYPHCIMQYNIGTETRIDESELPEDLIEYREKYKFEDVLNRKVDLSKLDEYNVTMTPNFEFYRKDKISFFSAIMRDLYNTRNEFKKKMLQAESDKQKVKTESDKKQCEYLEAKMNSMQMGLKILLNSGYGAFASSYFLYYMVENAEAITLSGQLVNKWTASQIEVFLQELFNSNEKYWIAGDTDSMYIRIDEFMDTVKESDIQKKVDIADRFCNEVIQPKIETLCDKLCEYLNCYEQKMVWSREVISETAIWVAKKKYTMNVWDSEGVRYTGKPKMKLTGLESVKSSTPEWARELLEEFYLYGLLRDKEGLQKRYREVKVEFKSYDANMIAIPSSVNGINKYYDKDNLYKSGTPKQVKASLVHNKMIKDLGLNRIQPIEDGNKIKYIELKMPNPTHQPVIAFDTYLPKEFEIEEYIDRDAIFEKSFEQPLKIFLKAINWTPEHVNTLF